MKRLLIRLHDDLAALLLDPSGTAAEFRAALDSLAEPRGRLSRSLGREVGTDFR